MKILKTQGYFDWFANLTKKEQMKVDSRILRIEDDKHFGDVKYLSEGLSELRWKNGCEFTSLFWVIIKLF